MPAKKAKEAEEKAKEAEEKAKEEKNPSAEASGNKPDIARNNRIKRKAAELLAEFDEKEKAKFPSRYSRIDVHKELKKAAAFLIDNPLRGIENLKRFAKTSLANAQGKAERGEE